MKTISTYLLFLSLVLCISCAKESRILPSSAPEIDRVVLTLDDATRSSTNGIDDVKTLDLLIYRKDNRNLECHSRVDGNQVTAKVALDRKYDYFVVANAPADALDGCMSEEVFLGTAWCLSDIGGGVAMSGFGEGTLSGGDTVRVGLGRLASMVSLEGITPSFLENGFKGSTVRLERVFLINVDGSCHYCGTPFTGEVWYNRLGIEPMPASLLPYLVKESGRILSGPERVNENFSFLCCPNPVDNGVTSLTELLWSVRNTRLVIELNIDGVPNYYPIDMPSMTCNTKYVVTNAVLQGPGSDNPDIPVSRSSISFSISVNPWTKDDGKEIRF